MKHRALGILPFVAILSACSGDDSGSKAGSGGSSTGGNSSGGTSSGGTSSGGSSSGGTSSGGTSSGGTSSGGTSSGGTSSGGTSSGGAGGGSGATLSGQYPGDVGIENDPAVVWVENFESGSVANVLTRYEDSGGQNNMALMNDVPGASSGASSMRLRAGGGLGEATDFYKRFDQKYDELFVRYYAKYQPNAPFHHTGVWIGGYSPSQDYPSPKAGLKPNGDDRISVSFEPMGGGANPRMDFYNYWMNMHTGPNYYWGNTLIHREDLHADSGQWMCVEIQVKLNPNPASSAGGELGLWKNDTEVIHFTDSSPVGYWIWDKFCPQPGATSGDCANYPPDPGDPIEPLDLQWRSSTNLQLDYFWPQNYNTDTGTPSDVFYDDMVIATQRVGCIQ